MYLSAICSITEIAGCAFCFKKAALEIIVKLFFSEYPCKNAGKKVK